MGTERLGKQWNFQKGGFKKKKKRERGDTMCAKNNMDYIGGR